MKSLWNRIKFKLLLFGLTMSIVPISIFGWYNIEISKTSLEESIQERQLYIAERAASEVDSLISSLNGRMNLIIDANSTIEIEGSKLEWEQSLYSFLKQNAEIENAYVYDQFGNVVAFASRWQASTPSTIKDIEYKAIRNQLARKSQGLVSNVKYRNDGSPYVYMGMPFYSSKDSNFNGGMIIEVNLRSTFKKVLSILTGHHGYIYIIDENQRLIAHTDFGQVVLGKEVVTSPTLANMIESEEYRKKPLQYTSYTAKEVIGVYRPIASTEWGVIIEHPIEKAYLAISRLVERLLFTMIIIISFVGLASIIFGIRFTRPIELLEKAVQKVTSGRLETKITYQSNDEFGKLSAAFNHMTSELKQKSQYLEQEKERLDTIINGSGAGFALIYGDHRVAWMNDRLKEWLGTKDLNQMCYSLLGNLVEPCQDCPISEKDLQKCQNEVISTVHNGRKIFRHRMYPLERVKEGEPQFLIVVEDITEQKQLEEMVVQADKLSALGILASGFAHEVNNPLASISVYAEDLKERIREEEIEELKETGEIDHYIDTIRNNVDRCKIITDSLLNFSRKSPLMSDKINLKTMVEDSLFLTKHALKKKGIVVENNVKVMPPVAGDEVQIQQVFVNLIQNAIDAMDEGGKLEIYSALNEDKAEIHFKDNGSGMSKEQIGKVFDPFFTTKPVGKGTGLGLYISYNIIKKMNGDITIRSEKGIGTDMAVIFPIA